MIMIILMLMNNETDNIKNETDYDNDDDYQ